MKPISTPPASSGFFARFLSLGIGITASAGMTLSALSASATWSGGAGTVSLNDALNWSGGAVPNASGDVATWAGTPPGDLLLTYSAGFGPGFGSNGLTYDIAAGQTGALRLDAIGTPDLNIGAINIAAGAGPFTIGDGTGVVNIVFRTAAAPNVNTLTNNSSNNATFASDVSFGSAGAADRMMTFTGTGNWVINGPYNTTRTAGNNLGITKDGTGRLTLNNVSNNYNQGTIIKAGSLVLGAGDTSTTVGVLGGSSRSVLLGDTTGSANASLLNAGFTVGNPITVQTGSTGMAFLGGSAATTSTFSGNLVLGSPTGLPAQDATLVAAPGGTANFNGIIDEDVLATSDANLIIGSPGNTGTVILGNSANSYGGTTTVTAGKLNVAGNVPGAVAINGAAALSGTGTIAGPVTVAPGNTSATQGTIDLTNGAVGTLTANGGLTLGGASAGLASPLKMEVLSNNADQVALGSGTLTVGAGGAPITITNIGGISSGQTYPLLTFASGTGAGFATGTGTTVGAFTLTNPSLSFGVTGTLNVTSTAVRLVTSGAAAPATAYWRGVAGTTWASTNGGGGNFSTDAAGTTQVQSYPAGNTNVIFSATGATNLTQTLGQSFAVQSLTFGGASPVTINADGNTLTLGSGGLTIPSGTGPITIGANLSGVGTANNAGQLTLSGNSPALTGGVVNTGTLTFGSATALGAGSPLTANGGTVNLNGFNVTTASLSGNTGAIITNTVNGTATLTVSSSTDTTFAGLLQNGSANQQLALTHTGNTSLTLTGLNTYTGPTTVNGGTLVLQGSNNSAGETILTGGVLQLASDSNGGLASGPILFRGGTLEASGAARSAANALSLEADSFLGGNADLTLNGILTLSSSRTLTNNLAGGTVILSNAVNHTGTGTSVFTLNGTGATNTLIDGQLTNGTGVLGFTRSGGGRATLSNTNSYTGVTTSQGGGGTGLLVITGSNAGGGIYNVGDASAMTFDTPGTIEAASLNYTAFGSVVNINQGTINVAGAVTSTNVSNSRFLNLNGGVLKVGTSVFSSTTAVIVNFNGGTLKSGSAAGLAFESTVDTTISSHTATILGGGGTIDTTLGNITSTATFNGTAGGRLTVRGGSRFTSIVTNSGPLVIEDNSTWDLDGTGGTAATFLDSSVGGLSGNGVIDNASGTNGVLTINFADGAGPFDYAGTIAGAATLSLVKQGTGTQTLSGTNTYQGNTTIGAGTLALSNNSATTFADASTLSISAGAVLHLPNAATDTVASLILDGLPQAAGVYDSSTPGGYITGSGKIRVGAGGYATWAADRGLTLGVNDGTGQDPDFDGIPNLLEYVLGGLPIGPGAANPGILPTQAVDANNITVSFNRSDLSEVDTALRVQISTGLGIWSDFATVGPVSSGPVTVTEDAPTAALDTVTVLIPRAGNAADGKLFVRIKAATPL